MNGDYVLSNRVVGAADDSDFLGTCPSRFSSTSKAMINDSNMIIKELNELSGTRALGVSAGINRFIALANAESIPRYWYFNSTWEEAMKKFQNKDISVCLSTQTRVESRIYGINSDDLIPFYKNANGFEFYDLTGEKGIYLPDKVKSQLNLTKDTKSILLFYGNDNKIKNPYISVPIAGFYSVPEKEYREVLDEYSLSYNKNEIVVFLDMDYYYEIFPTVRFPYPKDFASFSLEETLSFLVNGGETQEKREYENIWIRTDNLEGVQRVLRRYGGNLSLNSSFEALLPASFVKYTSTSILLSSIAFVVIAIAVLMLTWTVVRRVTDYEEKAIKTIYLLGTRRGLIVKELFKKTILPMIPVSIIACICGATCAHYKIKKDIFSYICTPRCLFLHLSPILSVLLLVTFLIGIFSIYFLVKNITLDLRDKRKGRTK